MSIESNLFQDGWSGMTLLPTFTYHKVMWTCPHLAVAPLPLPDHVASEI